MASITLTHTDINGGTPVSLLNSKITISGKKKLDKTPNAVLATDSVEIQVLPFENLKYVISSIHFTGAANTFTYTDWLALYKTKVPATLLITYGDSIVLPSLTGSTSGISVFLEVPSISIDTTDSLNGYMPMGSLTFSETG